METSQLRVHLVTAINAAVAAGAVIMEVYNGDLEISYKADDSPLTLADRRANEVIMSHLKLSGIPVISEENKQVPFEDRKNWSVCWMVDPLDGTKEFIKRNGEFTVNIAMIVDGAPVMGVIYTPATADLYFAISAEKQAAKINLSGKSLSVESIFQEATILTPKAPVAYNRVVGSRSHMNDDTLLFLETLKTDTGASAEMVSVGSSLKFCLLSEDKADVYPRFAPTMEWDTAAGHAICKALDIKVYQQDQTTELQYNKPNLLNPYFIAAHDQFFA
ncbi:3'(2'),5'-bisphosphate nucleotidase CysQ [Paucihalobacter ruber]|uniref:3'(2'),5'-bisphosphate nucleotidase CysQ n=1 Tax=Paucihalobacter ruber TaxID=2567861 RepID=A0A506PJ33_9FLAO|nr:3'(2'),5'-bisphosphate nucleotidase CysQ [Paucihalobacter ruber]TPV33833.1 3'(2'),5'-bisphosphate nucleotidase CysQ [Paucihalobacter ruber]